MAQAAQFSELALEEREAEIAAQREFDPFEGGYPVPPMPGQTPQPSRRQSLQVSATSAPTPEVEGQ